MVEREVRAHDERVAEEDGEADEPGTHEREHEASPPPLGPLPGPSALRRGNRGRARGYGTPPPPLACFTCASSCLSRSLRPAGRSFTLPACHFVTNVWTRFVSEAPDAMIGDVPDLGFAKIFKNGAKCASGMSSFECVDAV